MTAEHHLHSAYQEWRRLAEAEGEAIRSGNWMLVCDCQSALKQLQPDIIRFTGEARQEWADLGLDVSARENRVRQTVSGLIELEQRNNSLLEGRRQKATTEFKELNQARLVLRRIHRSYAPGLQPEWTSFS